MSKKQIYKVNHLGELGQGLLEYLLISSLIGLFCLSAMKQLGEVLDRRAKEVKAKIVDNLHVGTGSGGAQ